MNPQSWCLAVKICPEIRGVFSPQPRLMVSSGSLRQCSAHCKPACVERTVVTLVGSIFLSQSVKEVRYNRAIARQKLADPQTWEHLHGLHLPSLYFDWRKWINCSFCCHSRILKVSQPASPTKGLGLGVHHHRLQTESNPVSLGYFWRIRWSYWSVVVKLSTIPRSVFTL